MSETDGILIDELVENPTFFIRDVLGDRLWEKQREIVESVRDNKRTTVRSCHNVGKTFTAARLALWFLQTRPESIIVTTAPTARQVEDILWREIRKAFSKTAYPLAGVPFRTKIEISEKWFAVGLSTNEADRFQGMHAENILFIVDESAGVEEEIYNAIEGSLSNQGAKLLLLGNATSLEGTFYKSHRNPNYSKIHISAFDSPNFTAFHITLDDIRNEGWKKKINGPYPAPWLITPEWVADMFVQWGEESPMFQARVLGNFPEQGTDTLIPLNYIEKAVGKFIPPKDDRPDFGQVGVDVARFGSNKTVFVYRKGYNVERIQKHALKDTMQTAGLLTAFMAENPGSLGVVDNVGVGAGVVDRLYEEQRKVVGVNVGMKPRDEEQFVNIRAEAYWNLRDLFITGKISIPDDGELIGQLATLKYKFTSKGLRQIEGKDDMVKRGLVSPDCADALALSFYPTGMGSIAGPIDEDVKPITAGLYDMKF